MSELIKDFLEKNSRLIQSRLSFEGAETIISLAVCEKISIFLLNGCGSLFDWHQSQQASLLVQICVSKSGDKNIEDGLVFGS